LGRLAEVVNQYMATSKRVRVIGRLEYQSWTDKASGEQRSRAVIVARQVLFLDYDRVHLELPQEPVAQERATLEVGQPEAQQPAKSKGRAIIPGTFVKCHHAEWPWTSQG
jgi:single-stranded DNA-binding protein